MVCTSEWLLRKRESPGSSYRNSLVITFCQIQSLVTKNSFSATIVRFATDLLLLQLDLLLFGKYMDCTCWPWLRYGILCTVQWNFNRCWYAADFWDTVRKLDLMNVRLQLQNMTKVTDCNHWLEHAIFIATLLRRNWRN